jgi:hypothetical protein
MVAGTVAAILGTISFLVVYRTWHPHPAIKALIVVVIIALSKFTPYAYLDTLSERATSCGYGNPNFLATSVASTDFLPEVPGPNGHVVSIKHEKCFEWVVAGVPSYYFVFVHTADERDDFARLVLRYRSCLERPPTVTWGGSALLVSISASGGRSERQDKREVTQCGHDKVTIVTRQRSGTEGIPIRYNWAGSPPDYDLDTVPELVLKDLKFSLQYCKLTC